MTDDLFNIAPCGFLAFFENGTIFLTNKTSDDILGYDAKELEGKSVETIFPVATKIFYQTHFFPLLKLHGAAEEIFITLRSKSDEHLPVLLNARRSILDGNAIISCAFILVPNRKKFEDELVLAKKVAEAALNENSALLSAKESLREQAEILDSRIQLIKKQNQELRQLNHVITHSLKEPLRKILMFSGRLKDDFTTADLEKLIGSSEQLKNVISGLQEYLWLDEKKDPFTKVNLQKVLETVIKTISQEFNVELSVRSDELPIIEGDREQLTILFLEIFKNAVKFRKSTPVKIIVSATVLKHNIFREMGNQYKYEDHLKLEFRDEGTGFDPEYREVVFDLFRKLSYADGQGVGLALCRKIAQNHYGWIEADSKISEFTTIRIWLPVDQGFQ